MLASPRFSTRSIAIATSVLFIGFIGQAAATLEEKDFSFDTTAELYDVCSTEDTNPNYAMAETACTAFIEATVQYHDAVSDRKRMKRLICYPKGTTIADGHAAFLSWAKQNKGNEKLMGEMPVVGLVRSLAKAYPCK